MPPGHENASMEQLVRAVQRMDPLAVQHCCDAGLNVNDAVDPYGHTVMDVFATEQQALLKSCTGSRGRPQDATRLFIEAQQNATEVMRILQQHGAVMTTK